MRRLPGQHPAPLRLRAVGLPLVPAAALARLDDHRLGRAVAEEVALRVPAAVLLGVDPPGLLHRRGDGDRGADRGTSRAALYCRRIVGQPPSAATARASAGQVSPCRSRCRCTSSTRVPAPSGVNVTSTSEACAGSGSSSNLPSIAQDSTSRRGGSQASTDPQTNSVPSLARLQPPAAHPGLDDPGRRHLGADVVGHRPPVVEALGEERERLLRRHRHRHLLADLGLAGCHRHVSSSSRSTAALKASSALVQNRSR